MSRLRGKLKIDAEGLLCLEMRLTPQNPNVELIPLAELMEEFKDKNILIDIFPLTSRYEEEDK